MTIHRDKYDAEDFFTYGSQDFIDEMKIYTDLLDLAPQCGPHAYVTRPDFNYEWSSNSRDNTYAKDSIKGKTAEYHGMDYMLLHNLLYIAFMMEDFHVEKYDEDDDLSNEYYPLSAHNFNFKCSIINADVVATAKHSILLDAGFNVDANSHFKAVVTPLSGIYNATDYKKLNVTPCDEIQN